LHFDVSPQGESRHPPLFCRDATPSRRTFAPLKKPFRKSCAKPERRERERMVFDVVHSSLYLYEANDGCLWISGTSSSKPFTMRRYGRFEGSISLPARSGRKLHNSRAP